MSEEKKQRLIEVLQTSDDAIKMAVAAEEYMSAGGCPLNFMKEYPELDKKLMDTLKKAAEDLNNDNYDCSNTIRKHIPQFNSKNNIITGLLLIAAKLEEYAKIIEQLKNTKLN